MYPKTALVCGGYHEHLGVCSLHPPVDRLLLSQLAREDSDQGRKQFWREYRDKGWSNFDADDYEAIIGQIRVLMEGCPLWAVEQYWVGHQRAASDSRAKNVE